MRHNLDNPTTRTLAIRELNQMLRWWRPQLKGKRANQYAELVLACECAIQALGGDPDGPDTQP